MYGFDNECQIERSKTIARWLMILIIGLLLRSSAFRIPSATYWSLVGGIAAVNLLHTLYLFRVSACPRFYKYVSVAIDLLFTSAVILLTGGAESPFFYVYFLILISNCIRYGLLMSLFIAVLVNVLYTVVLGVLKPIEPSVLGGEGLKILAFWGVALYGGSVAARMRRQAFEIAAYEETIAELRQRLGDLPREEEQARA